MDIGALIMEAAVCLVSSATGVLIAVWKVSSHIQKIEDTAKLAHEAAKQNGHDLDVYVKEQGESWQILNRTLGQIEGSLGLEATTKPGKRTR